MYFFKYCKLQFCCLLVLAVVSYIYVKETNKQGKKSLCNPIFDLMLVIAGFEIEFDGLTAFFVNYEELVPHWVNLVFHLVFFVNVATLIFLNFIYMLQETSVYPSKKWSLRKVIIFTPYIITLILIILFIGKIEFRHGNYTNYSMGKSVYACFAMVIVYHLATCVLTLSRWRYISKNKRTYMLIFLITIGFIIVLQLCKPEVLLTSAAALFIVLGIYLTAENPLYKELSDYNKEMVMGFSTLVENRDDNTGGHILRTSLYVERLAREIRDRGIYTRILTEDYINNLRLAAPMHDIGKIGIPDSILQKPGKLTDSEFEVMKTHSTLGGKIISSTFGEAENKEYADLAYKVAMYHHEKWNGNGYPEGLSENEIPLCARIMAIADVFDAVSEKRCYKDALPLEQCFNIIEDGIGRDFDPQIAQVFLDIREDIIEIHKKATEEEGRK